MIVDDDDGQSAAGPGRLRALLLATARQDSGYFMKPEIKSSPESAPRVRSESAMDYVLSLYLWLYSADCADVGFLRRVLAMGKTRPDTWWMWAGPGTERPGTGCV